MMQSFDVVVVGGGVIGSSVAWRAAASGRRVALVDPDVHNSASWLAGGMLAPATEAWPGEEKLLELGARSLETWPEFAAALAAGGHDPGLRSDGTVAVAADGADMAVLDELADYLRRLGRDVERLTGRALRRLEPAIGPAVRGGLAVPGDLAVDNRRLLTALHSAGEAAGVVRVRESVTGVRPLRTTAGTELACGVVVIAAGAHSARLHPALQHAIRPVKGEILRLRARRGSLPPPRHTVRGRVEGRPVYLVPRDTGEVVLGATEYEAGYDTEPVVRGVLDLLADAERLLPSVADYTVTEVSAGLRAGSTDNLPVIDWVDEGVLAAAGHHRNGLLLAPATAQRVLSLLEGDRT